jgi:hypothetical protein
MKINTPSRGAVIGAGLLFCLSARALHWVCQDTYLAHQSKAWPTTDAVIMHTKAELSLGGGPGSQVQWAPRVSYQFSIGAHRFTGNNISFPSRRGSKTEAERKVAQYAVGATVPAYYNPDSPEVSCLERGKINYFFIVMMGSFGLLMGAGGLLTLYWGATRST